MSAPAVSPAVATSTRVQTAAEIDSTPQGADDAPTDLFQDLMQALSADTALPGSGDPSALASDLPTAENTQLPTERANSLALLPDYVGLGLVFAQPMSALPPAVQLTLKSTTEGQSLPPDGLTAATNAPVAAGNFNDPVSPTQALLDRVRGETSASLTTLPSALGPLTPPALAKQVLSQELSGPNPIVTPDPTVGKITQTSWATALGTAITNATAKSHDLPLETASQPAIPITPDAASGIRQTTANTLDTPGVYRSTLQSQPSSPVFPAELVSELRFLLKGGLQHAELRMNPVELGPVQIELRLNDQVADIGFTAAHAATREGIAQSLPQLREMLSGQGLSLGHTSVGAQAQGQQQAQQERTRPDPSPSSTGCVVSNSSMAVRVGDALRSARGVLDLYA